MHQRGSASNSRNSSAHTTPTRGRWRNSTPSHSTAHHLFPPNWDRHLPVPKLGFRTCAGVVFLAAILCFVNSYDADFVFDDSEAIINNKDLESTEPLSSLFVHDFWGSKLASSTSHKSYRPLTVLTFRWNYLIAGGLHPQGFHVVNILLHGLVSVLLLWVVSVCLCGQLYSFSAPKASLLCALLFAVHPIHTESVSGVVGRADLLCALTVFMSFLSYVRSCQIDEDHIWRPSSISLPWLALSMLLCATSVLFKEQGITSLGLCSAFDIIIECRIDFMSLIGRRDTHLFSSHKNGLDNNSNQRNIHSRSPSHSNHSTPSKSPKHKQEVHTGWIKALVFRHFILLITGLVILSVRLSIMGSSPPTFQVVDNPHSFVNGTILRLINYNYLYSINAWLLLNPWWLCFDWSMGCVPVISSIFDLRLAAVILFWVVMATTTHSCLTLQQSTYTQVCQMSLALLVVPFLPASNLFFRVGFVVAERILYLPSVGYCMLVTLGAVLLSSFWRNHKRIIQVVLPTVLVLYIWRSINRSNEWRNEFDLFESGASVCPLNAKVHYNIAKIHGDTGKNIEYAISKYRLAISLHPEYDQAMNNLANILKERGGLLEAESLLDSATQIRSDFSAAWMNLGIVQAALHKYNEAETSYITAIKHRRKYPDCYYNLGNLYLEISRHTDALVAWRNATLLKPTHASAWVNMIILLDNMGRLDELRLTGKEALKHLPDHAAVHYNIGNGLCKAGHYFDCEDHFKMAVEIEPNNPVFYSNLGVLYHRWGKNEQAEKAYMRAIELDPGSTSAKENLHKLRRKMDKKKA